MKVFIPEASGRRMLHGHKERVIHLPVVYAIYYVGFKGNSGDLLLLAQLANIQI